MAKDLKIFLVCFVAERNTATPLEFGMHILEQNVPAVFSMFHWPASPLLPSWLGKVPIQVEGTIGEKNLV